VTLHGGEITAHSAGIGKGAEFVVRLPLELSEPAMPPVEQPAGVQIRHRLLIIEDNRDAAESLRLLLELCGHQTETAYDGLDGISKARKLRPDVVLCDIGLPGMDGYAVARAFRADAELAGVHLVALSGYALPEDLERAHEAGFDRHVAKPPMLDKLQELLSDLCRETRA
jgi:CheY-like chemotaxis protein